MEQITEMKENIDQQQKLMLMMMIMMKHDAAIS